MTKTTLYIPKCKSIMFMSSVNNITMITDNKGTKIITDDMVLIKDVLKRYPEAYIVEGNLIDSDVKEARKSWYKEFWNLFIKVIYYNPFKKG